MCSKPKFFLQVLWRLNVAKRILAVIAICVAAGQAYGASSADWELLRNERFGFRVEYPSSLFRPHRTSQAGDGIVLESEDGGARLLVGAFANNARHSPASYQRYLARQSYRSFPVTYAPRGRTWFVLSGEQGGKIFYEKVMFSCGDSVITSFAMTYPAAQRHRFDAVVERMENSFQPASRCS
jgi:hypothetical protein